MTFNNKKKYYLLYAGKITIRKERNSVFLSLGAFSPFYSWSLVLSIPHRFLSSSSRKPRVGKVYNQLDSEALKKILKKLIVFLCIQIKSLKRKVGQVSCRNCRFSYGHGRTEQFEFLKHSYFFLKKKKT